MLKSEIKERLTRLEQRVAKLEKNGLQPETAWREAIRLIEGDELTQQVFQYAMRYREADRRRARRANRRRRAKTS
jgi:septation ring formation regulator EzrA